MRRVAWLATFLISAGAAACDDETGGPSGGGDQGTDATDSGGDSGPADQGGDDGLPDGGGDTGQDNGGGDGGGDGGTDGGGGAFASCVPTGAEECSNGFDDDCDGRVDEGCGCFGGANQDCYLGAAGDLEAENAICTAGSQNCGLEFWDECTGAVGPAAAEDCLTELDDNCDGEVNEGCEQVGPTAICPANFQGPVLATYLIEGCYEEGENPIASLSWRVVNAPPGHSFDLRTFTADAPSVTCADVPPHNIEYFADVAGAYTYEFTVTDTVGLTGTCQTEFQATTADVIRVELSWNPDYEEGEGLPRDRSDFDLYVLRDPDDGDNSWYYYRDRSGFVCSADPNVDSCHWRNCTTCPDSDDCEEGDVTYISLDANPDLAGVQCDAATYAAHDCQRLTDREVVRECLCRDFLSNPPEDLTPEDVWPPPRLEWGPEAEEDDPRLDLDDTEGKGPENINVRLPEAGTYRIAVHFFEAEGFGTVDGSGCRHADAQVRVLCAGAVVFESELVDMAFNDGSNARWLSDMWEVGDLELSFDGEDPVCNFTEFGTEGDRNICMMHLATGGCDEGEARSCEGTEVLSCPP